MRDLLDGLNPEQRAAVVHGQGPLLVLAGAGSGKTRVLTLRIAHLVRELNVPPWSILALTFTNKAAKEMKERVGRFLGADAGRTWVSTFHSSCLRILRQEIDHLHGFDRNFVIYDDRDTRDLVKRILKDMGMGDRIDPRSMRSVIDRAKNNNWGPAELQKQQLPDVPGSARSVYEEYQRRLQQANALDFGDLLVKTIALLQDERIRRRYRDRFAHVLVDEYQDTNPAQYELLRLLADHGPRNVCVVGDEDQSIYSFRGADIRNILDFERDFEGATTVRLERNYRSTKTILAAATSVVQHNSERLGKTLWTEQDGGEPIQLHVAYDDREEARAAVSFAQREIRGGRQPRDIAVFYRTNAQSRLVEEEFLASRLPFVLVGGQRFYERKEIKDLLSYLKLLANPRDDVALTRVINEPPRGIGAKTVGSIAAYAGRTGKSMWDAVAALSEPGSELGSRARKALAGFRDIMDGLLVAVGKRPLPELVELVLDRSGMVQTLRDDGSYEAQGRLENLQELHSSALEWAEHDPATVLIDFLDRVALVADTDQIPEDDDEGRITLMTVHSSKGLEFPVVIVVGMDEGLFPHARASTFERELEEERRLAYVAITRAEEKLYLLRALRRPVRRGQRGGPAFEAAEPSRFLRHLPVELIRCDGDLQRAVGHFVSNPHAARSATPRSPSERYVEYDAPSPGRSRFGRGAGGGARRREQGTLPESLRRRLEAITSAAQADGAEQESAPEEPHFVPDDDAADGMIGVGTRVLHPKFGEGEVRVLDGSPDNLRATIFFRRSGNKKIYLRYAELEILSR